MDRINRKINMETHMLKTLQTQEEVFVSQLHSECIKKIMFDVSGLRISCL